MWVTRYLESRLRRNRRQFLFFVAAFLQATPGNFWQAGHDKKAESAAITLKYGSTKNAVAEFLLDNGFGPGGRNAHVEIEQWRNKGGTAR